MVWNLENILPVSSGVHGTFRNNTNHHPNIYRNSHVNKREKKHLHLIHVLMVRNIGICGHLGCDFGFQCIRQSCQTLPQKEQTRQAVPLLKLLVAQVGIFRRVIAE